MQRCLLPNPEARPAASEILELLASSTPINVSASSGVGGGAMGPPSALSINNALLTGGTSSGLLTGRGAQDVNRSPVAPQQGGTSVGGGPISTSLSNASVSSISAEVVPRGYRSSWAVIICVASYQSPDVPPLPYAANDAVELEHFLVSKGFQVIMLKDERATKDSIEELLGEYLKWKVAEDDCMLVFFAGQVQGACAL